jgi:asparagine synthase (glutamine-hydrolysing)
MDGINTYFVSQAARQAGLKVTLSGLGGDEVFGGYETFARTPALEKVGDVGGRMPRRMREAVASVAGGAIGMRARGDVVRKMTALWNDSDSLPHPYFFGRALFTPPQVDALLTGGRTNGNSLWWRWLSDSAVRSRDFDSFSAVTCLEAQSYLVNTLLRDTDSMSMAHSLEVRVPFLDHPLVEFVTQLPQELKLQKGRTKALLVRALADLLPAEVLGQKRGFTFPWAGWLRGPLKERLNEGFDNFAPALREAIDPESVKTIWRDYLNGKTSWSRPWSLYVLNEWVKRNL